MYEINYKKVNCWLCGREIETCGKTDKKYICELCKEKNKIIKQEKMFNNGLKAYKKINSIYGKNISKYELDRITKNVLEKCKGNKFYGSKDEVIVSLQLSLENINFEIQKSICGHKVDFILPDLCVVLEVDGELYHWFNSKDFLKDEEILNYLGSDWEIVRLPSLQIDTCVEIGIEKWILVTLEEKEYYKMNGYDENDAYWSQDSYSKRRYNK